MCIRDSLCGAQLIVEGTSVPISGNTGTSFRITTPAHPVGSISATLSAYGGSVNRSNAFTYTAGFTDDGTTPGADGNSSNGAVASKGGNGNDTSAGQSTTAAGETVAAAPMGVELYLQTVAVRADAQVACDDAAGARNEAASEFVGPLVNEQASASDHAVNGTSVSKIADADTVADIAEAIDLDHNGVADMCQLRAGDFDLNGMIDERDMSIILNMINTEPIMGIGDMDGNGEIDSADISVILLRMN